MEALRGPLSAHEAERAIAAEQAIIAAARRRLLRDALRRARRAWIGGLRLTRLRTDLSGARLRLRLRLD
jgi:hypothetical protein